MVTVFYIPMKKDIGITTPFKYFIEILIRLLFKIKNSNEKPE